jgi:hypothetical protein
LKRVNLRRKWPTIPKATAGGKLNKGKINMKLQNLIHIVIGIVCVGLLANAEAVNPPPDGGYPEANTAEGQNALFSLTTGVANTAVGWLSLNVLDTGKFNTAIGAATLIGNTADQNTATGAGALFNTSTGGNNTANGAFALFENLQAGDNTAIGSHALLSNTTGSNNVALGSGAGASATTGSNNVYVGAGMQGAAGERATLATSKASLTRPLPTASRSSLTQTTSSVPPLLQSASKKRSNQWAQPAKRSFHSRRLPFITRRKLIRQGRRSWASWLRT